ERVEGRGRERQRLLTAPQTARWIATHDVRRAGAPPCHHFEPKIVRRLPVLDALTAVFETPLPVSYGVGSWRERPQCSTCPPQIAAVLEHRQRAFPGFNCGLELSRRQVAVRERALGV